jgi:hypothetical protein
MNPKEVVETLLAQAKIEPGFTELGSYFVQYMFSFFFYRPPALLPYAIDKLVKFYFHLS